MTQEAEPSRDNVPIDPLTKMVSQGLGPIIQPAISGGFPVYVVHWLPPQVQVGDGAERVAGTYKFYAPDGTPRGNAFTQVLNQEAGQRLIDRIAEITAASQASPSSE